MSRTRLCTAMQYPSDVNNTLLRCLIASSHASRHDGQDLPFGGSKMLHLPSFDLGTLRLLNVCATTVP